MKKLIALVLIAMVLLTGCQTNGGQSEVVDTKEPTATYEWMAGESLVPSQRMGLKRAGVNNADHSIAPNGVYFMCSTNSSETTGESVSYLLYSDYGSDTVVKLCGRPDCNHENEDCNAYFENGCNIFYYNGYLYATESYGSPGSGAECILYRLDTDGSNRVVIFDFAKFAKENGADYATCRMIDSGVCHITTSRWIKEEHDDGTTGLNSEDVAYYLYHLDDGSMDETKGGYAPLYHCGDVFMTLMNGTRNGGYNGYDLSIGDWDPDTDTVTYLTDHPAMAGFYGREYGYYFRDGAVVRLNYDTREEERIIETGLNGSYYVMFFPECLVLLNQSFEATDKNLYIYNWAYELVDTIELSYLPNGISPHSALIAETAERLIFTDAIQTWIPKYYIEKSELGTGNAKIHSFKLPDLPSELLEYWEDLEWLNNG